MAELRQQGRCVKCGEPAFVHPTGAWQGKTSPLCPAHLAQERADRQARHAAGLCIACGQPAVRHESGPRAGQFAHHCLKHIVQTREYHRQPYGFIRRKDGLSYQAQRQAGQPTPEFPPPSPSGAAGKALQQQRHAQGLCVRCGQPALLHLWGRRKGQPAMLCLHHAREVQQQAHQKKPPVRFRASLVHAYEQAAAQGLPTPPPLAQVDRLAHGLCLKCGQPALRFTKGRWQGKATRRCLPHLIEQREAARLKQGTVKRVRSFSYEAEVAAGLASPERQPAPKQKPKPSQLKLQRLQQGLCVRCDQPAFVHLWGQRKGRPSAYCIQHMTQRREYIRQLYGCIRRIASPSYQAQPGAQPGEFWRQGRSDPDLRRAGLCTKCGQPAPVNLAGKRKGQPRLLCAQHGLENTDYQRRRNVLRQARASAAPDPQGPPATAIGEPVPPPPPQSRRAQGLCWSCGQPAGIHLSGSLQGQTYAYCPQHRKKRRKKQPQ